MNKKLFGFTLAEVLITLAIIGVVAALTLPTLITNYQKHIVETKLVKFYATMNQAFQMASATYGDISQSVEFRNYSYQENVDFLNKYVLPYIRYNSIEMYDSSLAHVLVRLHDGAAFTFRIDMNGGDIGYFINYDNRENIQSKRNVFIYQFAKKSVNEGTILNARSLMEPYTFNWDGTEDNLKHSSFKNYGCYDDGDGAYCAKLIQLNNWKIPKDYPW